MTPKQERPRRGGALYFRPTEVQGFYGALAGQRATKGVFITTSSFTPHATEFARSVTEGADHEMVQMLRKWVKCRIDEVADRRSGRKTPPTFPGEAVS